MKRITALLQASLLLALTALPLVAKDLPYKGQALGKVLEQKYIGNPIPGGEAFLWERAEATGKFTQLGDAKIVLDWVISLQGEGENLCFVLNGCFAIIAGDGSTMSGSFKSIQKCTETDNIIEVNVMRGTGRFTGVTGIIPGSGTRNGNDFTYNLDGLIWTARNCK
jgi:hypothetical protein